MKVTEKWGMNEDFPLKSKSGCTFQWPQKMLFGQPWHFLPSQLKDSTKDHERSSYSFIILNCKLPLDQKNTSEIWVICPEMERVSSSFFTPAICQQFHATEGQLLNFTHQVPLWKLSHYLNGFCICIVAIPFIWRIMFYNCSIQNKMQNYSGAWKNKYICHRFKKRLLGNMEATLLGNISDLPRRWDRWSQTKLVMYTFF